MGNLFGKPQAKKSSAAQQPNTVYLYQFSRWAYGPCQSMPCLRVEAFLRLHRIPHVIIPSMKSGPSGRWPWARFNGETLTDSQLIIDHVAKALGIDDGKHLTPEQRGTAVAVERMLDFHVYPFAVRWSWVDNFEMIKRFSPVKLFNSAFFTMLLQKFVRGNVITYLNAGGWGEYSNDEYRAQWVADVQAIADIIGDKPFMFGDTMTRTDASVYAYLQAYTVLPQTYVYPAIGALVAEGTPLGAYLRRIEARLFPDMKEICARAGSQEREVFPPALN